MALDDLERKRCERELETFMARRRPPPEIRTQVDLGCRMQGQSVELFEVRPHWQDPGRVIERPFAKATFVRSQQLWKIFWRRGDLKWHGYEPKPEVATLGAFLQVVDRDEHGCFFG